MPSLIIASPKPLDIVSGAQIAMGVLFRILGARAGKSPRGIMLPRGHIIIGNGIVTDAFPVDVHAINTSPMRGDGFVVEKRDPSAILKHKLIKCPVLSTIRFIV